MSKSFREDLTGKRFGRLTVLEFVPNDKDTSWWKCVCDCGVKCLIAGKHLKDGTTKSCGCFRIEHGRKMGKLSKKHNMSHTRLYQIWDSMKSRCYNSTNIFYESYGRRNIAICDEWKNDFMSFCNWAIANGYKDDLTIDRIDVNGNYCPENCRWISRKEQQRNKTNNIIVEYKCKKITLAEVSDKTGIKHETLRGRYHRGDRGERLFRPVKNK